MRNRVTIQVKKFCDNGEYIHKQTNNKRKDNILETRYFRPRKKRRSDDKTGSYHKPCIDPELCIKN